jgi:predicted PurR-regulated permease PerM
MARTPSNRALSQLVTLLTALVVVATLYLARVVLVPFVLAILFAFVLTPVVRRLDRIRIPRAASSAVVLIVVVCILGIVGWATTEQLVDVANQLPEYRSTIAKKIEVLRGSNNQRVTTATNAIREVGQELAGGGLTPAVDAIRATGSALRPVSPARPIPVEMVPLASNPLESLNTFIGPVSTFGIVTIFTLFMLIRREDLRNRLLRLVGQKHLNVMTQALDDAGSRVSRYLLLQLGVNVAYGFVVGLCLYFIGVPHVLLWGALAALLRFVPYVGFVVSSAFPILMSIAMFDGWIRPILTFTAFFVLELIVANLVEPFVYGTQVGLSSLAILVAAVFWTLLWGPVGLVLSTPLTVCLVVIGRYVPNLSVLNIILGDEPVLSPHSQFYQRLLASDQHEAKSVLESYLAQNNLQQLYDSVLIPALFLAEQDRHRNDLDEATQQFITLSTKELVEELYDHTSEEAALENGTPSDNSDSTAGMAPAVQQAAPFRSLTIACVPARDDADEIVGTMLAQLAERTGHRSQCTPVGPVAETVSGVEEARPDVICISALPPFAVSHARTLYLRLRARLPAVHILMGLWGSAGDPARLARRMRMAEGDKVVVNLAEAIAEIAAVATSQTPRGQRVHEADVNSLATPLVAGGASAGGG